MKCPYCGFADSKVVDSRPNDVGDSIRRRRECGRCNKRFTTYEQVESFPILVIKKDGKREPFDRNKLLRGLFKACEKRPVSADEVEAIAIEIEQAVRNSLEREISTAELGEMVMERLYKLDEVAYVRFASVYRQFRDVNSFYREIQKLLDKNDGQSGGR
ncbi:MAG TPA: transcriptional repressor NrdR [Clostridiales bacterium]|nr:transcriptional repressor NrdR [Clostridiales bacterium]